MNNEPDENGNVQIVEHILIRDVDTGEVMLNKRPNNTSPMDKYDTQ